MRPTRRGWAALGLSVLLVVFSLLLSSPFPLLGAILIGAWAVSRGHALALAVADLQTSLTVSQSVNETSIHPGASASIELAVDRAVPPVLAVTITGGPPAAADTDDPLTVSLTKAQVEASLTIEARWPVAGVYVFDPPTITATDGLFQHTITAGETPTVRVEAPSLRDIHVGVGGNRMQASYGEHKAQLTGSGIEPATIRPAVIGDPANHIDWKATARLGEPHVREFEIETDRETLLIADCRPSLGEGLPGSRKVDHLRSILLTVAESAAGFGDPLGAIVIDETGAAQQIQPGRTDATYRSVRTTLERLDVADTGWTSSDQSREPTRAITATRHLAALGSDQSQFARTLRPYLRSRPSYRRRFASDSLFDVVQTATSQTRGSQWVIIATDDSRPDALHETIAFLRGNGHVVSCYLTPSVLYQEPSDPDIAFDQYETFETFRRELAAIPGVEAFEVGPQDRLSQIIDAGRSRRVEVSP